MSLRSIRAASVSRGCFSLTPARALRGQPLSPRRLDVVHQCLIERRGLARLRLLKPDPDVLAQGGKSSRVRLLLIAQRPQPVLDHVLGPTVPAARDLIG